MTHQTDWLIEREKGIERATRGASDAWLGEARDALERVVLLRSTFTSTTVYWAMDAAVRDTAKGQSMAGVLRDGQARGLCEPTPEHRCERRISNHGRPQRVWRSLVVGRPR